MSVTLTIDALSVSYGREPALEIPQLTLSGEIIAVIGHNGAGKSTLIKSVLGLLPIKKGSIEVRGAEGPLLPTQHMAFCPETGAVFGDIAVEHYVQFWCRIKRGDPLFYQKEGAPIIERLAIAPLFEKLGRELSKGQKRRVQTAIGFLIHPKLFLFDEPFEGLDVQRSQELANLLIGARDETAVLVTSHRMDVIERIADKVILLEQGSVKVFGTVREVARLLAPLAFEVDTLHGKELSREVKKKFPRAVCQEHPGRIVVVGSSEADHEKLYAHLREAGAARSFEPSLADAMELHLALL